MRMISESVAKLEECKARLNILCGEILATLTIKANQAHSIAELSPFCDRWRKAHETIVNDFDAAGRGEGS